MADDKEIKIIEGKDPKSGQFVKGNKFHETTNNTASKKTNIRKQVLNSCRDTAPKLIKQMLEQALAGDVKLQCYIMDIILPARAIHLEQEKSVLENVVTQEDVNVAMTDVIRDVGRGEISIEDGFQVANILDKKAQSIQVCLQKELLAVQERLDEISGN